MKPWLFVSLLVGCSQDGGTPRQVGEDTGKQGGGDSEPGGSGGPGGGSSGGELLDRDPLGADGILWHGERKVTYTGLAGKKCQQSLLEEGEQLYGPGFLLVERSCETCERVFRIHVEEKGLCFTQGNAPEIYRGLDFKADGAVDVYRITQDGAAWESEWISEGTYTAAGEVTYRYEVDDILYRSIVIDGTIQLE